MSPDLRADPLFKHYLQDGNHYEALFDKDERLHSSWETFFHSFHQLGYTEVNNRHHAMLRLLKENGVTYNIYGDPDGLNRPWELDMLPYLISRQEWDFIEHGLTQRAELFNLILKDIYGERRLIKEGLLPMELIYRHTGFLRPCAGMDYEHNNRLILYAADMARGSDGRIWVVNDRTQAPSGSGYALENRTAMSRIFPELFNGLKVRQLQPYFTALRSALQEVAPHAVHNPRTVILTPGPNNETYFEHAYLASYLGFALVQGNDLIVKDNKVWLKTLEGLEKVDVILRRVDDVYCDPLELKPDSQLGVPGLLQVVRSGQVRVVNPLGSGILENPGLMPFLENIARYFFSSGLLMPNIASWWCGQPKELSYVLEHLDTLVIKRIYRESGAGTSMDAAHLSLMERDELRKKIQADPALYVGQEKVEIPSGPSLVNGKIVPRNSLFRSFLTNNGNGYTIMAGGLSRTSADEGNFIISNQAGGLSKDTWVLAPEPERIVNVLKEMSGEMEAASVRTALPSHTAENLFWVGRYTERVLGNARFIRTVIQYIHEGNRLMEQNDIYTRHCLLKALTQYTYTAPGFSESKKKLEHPLPELKDIVFNGDRSGSLKYNYTSFSKAVFAVRDYWSTDVWRLLRGMEEVWTPAADQQHVNLSVIDPLNRLITSMVAFMGLNRESLAREQGWLMLDAGRKIEQGLLLMHLLQSTLVQKHPEEVEYNLLESILVSSESLVSYRYKYRTPIQLPLVIDLLLFDPSNPRSLQYQLNSLDHYFRNLPHTLPDGQPAGHESILQQLLSLLAQVPKNMLWIVDNRRKKYKQLEVFLCQLSEGLLSLPEAISRVYFEHAQLQQQLFYNG